MVTISIWSKPIRYGYAYIKISGKNTQSSIHYIENTWKQFFPKKSFDVSFVDDRIAHLYDNEIRLSRLLNIFAFLAIIISCTGLFSLVSLMVRKRTKEIGIRKILGASVTSVTKMLSKDFIKLVFIACLIAFHVAWFAMNKWLQSFAYRIHISWWIFLIAGVTAILIVLITVSFQAIKAAVANPVESLRSE